MDLLLNSRILIILFEYLKSGLFTDSYFTLLLSQRLIARLYFCKNYNISVLTVKRKFTNLKTEKCQMVSDQHNNRQAAVTSNLQHSALTVWSFQVYSRRTGKETPN